MISVLMASYNYEAYMGEAIRSVLGQTFRNIELLVIDDGSRDGSLELARTFAVGDARVRVLRHPDGGNHGLPETLKLGIAEARGEWIAFLESDDIWEPECLEKRLKALPDNETMAVFNAIRPLATPGADTRWFDSYVPRVMEEHMRRVEESRGAIQLASSLLVENKIPTFSCIMLRADILRQCSLEAPVPRWLDWWIWIQISQRTAFCYFPEELTLWRIHAGSYNHRVSLHQYIEDNRRLWKGFQTLRHWYREAGKKWEALFLLGPFWGRLLARFYLIAYKSGMSATLRCIRSRIR